MSPPADRSERADRSAGLERPSFCEARRFWLFLGFISFGGPAGQIAIMHRELVERKRWIGEKQFLHALNFCMLLPGPEATQLATYCGWLLHGIRGGLVAGILFVLPGALALWGLSWLYVSYGTVPAVAGIFHGLKAAVLAIVVASLLHIGRRTLRSRPGWIFAITAFWALAYWRTPFPAVVFAALGVGFLLGARWPRAFAPDAGADDGDADTRAAVDASPAGAGWRTGAAGLALWFAPVLIAGAWLGWDSTLARLGIFFSKAAVVTFGGAYAVLPYVSQQAVEQHHWLAPGQMLDGLGLAETTPGPLILVLQFVGFLAGWRQPEGLHPLAAATLGAGMTTWVTFVPTYLFVLLGAPYVERLRRHAGLAAALAAVTAAVVGVIFNLAVWLAQQTLTPGGGLDGFALAVAVLAFAALHFLRVGILPVVLASGLIGLAWTWLP